MHDQNIYNNRKKNPQPQGWRRALTHMVDSPKPQLCLAVISGLAEFLRADVVCPASTVSPGVGIGLCHNSWLDKRRQSQDPVRNRRIGWAHTLPTLPLRWVGA